MKSDDACDSEAYPSASVVAVPPCQARVIKRRPDRQRRHASLLPAVATENPLPTDIRPLVAASGRQTAVAEPQLCMAAWQQELLNAFLAAHQPHMLTGTGSL